MMWGALIGAAGSLIGGAMQSKSAKNAANQERSWAVEDQAEQFVRLRAAAEKAGFNPLTALGAAPNSGMVNPTQAAQSYMGEAIATSSLMLADSMSKTAAAATGKKLQNANRANADLSRKLTAATLRPKMAGVFDRVSRFGTGAPTAKPDEPFVPEKLFIPYEGPNGETVYLPNPNVADSEQVTAAFGALAVAKGKNNSYRFDYRDPEESKMRGRSPMMGDTYQQVFFNGPIRRGGVTDEGLNRWKQNSGWVTGGNLSIQQ